MTDSKQGTRFHRILLAGSLVMLTAGAAWGADKTCLTGTDPSVAADAAQIEVLEAELAAACPCANFDGSDGKARRDYLKCVTPRIKAAVVAGELRSKCKSRVGKAHKLSTCGRTGVIPCVETRGDKVRCRIAKPEKCQSDSRYTRAACSSHARCIDAGDSNGDLLVAAGDAGACIVPPTPTFTVTYTPTPTPTDTETPPPTPTATATDLPTEPPGFGWTFCSDLGGVCTLPGNREVRFTDGNATVSKFITGTTVLCDYSVFDPFFDAEFSNDPHCDYFIDEPTRTPTVTATPTATATFTATATPEEGWVFCADENETCTVPSLYRAIRYGAPGGYIENVASSTSFPCTTEWFGYDPAYNQVKHCEYSVSSEVLPTFTATPTVTPTVTNTPTSTPTAAPEWVRCAGPGEICVLPARDQMVSLGGSPPPSNLITSVTDTAIECSAAALFPDRPEAQGASGDCYYLSWTCDYDIEPVGYLAINRFGDFPEIREIPRPAISELGYCEDRCDFVHALSADFEHELTAITIDPRICSPDDQAQLSYRWVITPPPNTGMGPGQFVPQGITGYLEPTLKILPQSMPNLDSLNDRRWRLHLETTRLPHTDYPMTPAPIVTTQLFFFLYTEAGSTIAQAIACHYNHPPGAPCPNSNMLPAPPGTY
ncbi:MAG TPA: hypothetical protein VEB21_01925 [Terriglobales bacterium]|nr:hypothetical protein [Terriglobales bacterium]